MAKVDVAVVNVNGTEVLVQRDERGVDLVTTVFNAERRILWQRVSPNKTEQCEVFLSMVHSQINRLFREQGLLTRKADDGSQN